MLKAEDDKLTVGAAPYPLKLTICTLPAAPLLLSVMVNVPVREPTVVGEKVTMTVQLPPALTLLPHVLAWEKSPLAATALMASGTLLVLVTITGLGGLEVPKL